MRNSRFTEEKVVKILREGRSHADLRTDAGVGAMIRVGIALASLVVATACSARPAVATPPPPSSPVVDARPTEATTCPDGPRTHIERNADGDLELDPDHGAYDGKAILDWQIDLNGDLALDLGLTLMGTTGNKGEAVIGVFVNCGDDNYVAVWGPDYIFAIELPPDADKVEQAPGTWRELIAVFRREQADREQIDRIEKKTLRFEQGRYKAVP